MADLYSAMKTVAYNAIKNSNLCDLTTGYVVGVSPLEVKLSDRIVLNKNQLLLTQAVTEKTVNVKHRHNEAEPDKLPEALIVRDGLKTGDGVLLLRVQNGQKFVILSKVVE